MTSKCLRELIAEADERSLAASGLACLERCLPLSAADVDALRPLWAGLARGAAAWPVSLASASEALAVAAVREPAALDPAASLVRQMLDAAPSVWETEPLREWADDCSVAALELHHRFDAGPGRGEPAAADVVEVLKGCREGAPAGAGPLVAGELRRQVRVLEILAAGEGGAGLRQVLGVSTEGRRVLRAVVSRQARVRG
ncbi:hypothetical protein [Streptomyces clavuligerus]|uniref:hypothetical protein n=1 Tax=Streptomyces clavuligerus TaxID=1901 RepID=UPI00020D92B8|nr:hypothetical protein [Streptomyces clavuligerus]ANW18510.1 hypothetical protein BB341_09825 [Streptomyces clavuligerus]AXU13067.1 hypothetical protein D1794_10165 [Streptomyces clavuligerus]MBY6303003.1 hypothetical protein [Streptomyces clavuligerus]QCS05850.1 hypothetical protein CRV15_09595 [Streptomyces clavuligerus]QPJ94786.1 hypothetical protein GE265_18345 [Streptomyces clavuligerus]